MNRNCGILNDTHRKNLCFTYIITVMAAWLLLTFFICHRHVFIWQSVEIFNLFSTLTLKPFFSWKRLQTHHFYTKLLNQKPWLRHIEWWVQNEARKKNLPYFFEYFASVEEPLTKSWFDVPTTQMSIFILFVSAEVFFDGVFFPVSILKQAIIL